MIVKRSGAMTEFLPSPREKWEGLIGDHVSNWWAAARATLPDRGGVQHRSGTGGTAPMMESVCASRSAERASIVDYHPQISQIIADYHLHNTPVTSGSCCLFFNLRSSA